MLDLRPNCEFCDKDLPPASTEACICSYECTFCSDCVESLLQNVCPNCGGGFVKRPIRPGTERRTGTGLVHHPASINRVHTKYSRQEISEYVNTLKGILPEQR